MKKIYILDTSVLLENSNIINFYPNSEIVIPLTVINELDKFKKSPDEIGRNSREVIRKLDEISLNDDIISGIKLENDSILKLFNDSKLKNINKNDDKIINCAFEIQKENNNVVLLTQDINMRVKARTLGIVSEQSCVEEKINVENDSIYHGFDNIIIEDNDIDKFYRNRYLLIPKEITLLENQFVTLTSNIDNKKTGLGIVKNNKILKIKKNENIFGITPKNKEQSFALNMLLDNDIHLVTILGKAGTGKTLLALAASLHMIFGDSKDLYNKLIITKPMVPLGKEIGFIPGTEKEKLDPWMRSIYDNLHLLIDDYKDLQMYIEKGMISMECLTFMRGRSVPKSIILVDEAQNMNKMEMKTILTRAGINSKVIITADINQIDSPYLDYINNGATYCVQKMKGQNIYGHIILQKGERSKLATIASKLL